MSTLRSPIDIDDTDFVHSHMRTPKGRGSWAFATTDAARHDVMHPTLIWTPSMTYTDAKVWAKAKARAMQADSLLPQGSITLYSQP